MTDHTTSRNRGPHEIQVIDRATTVLRVLAEAREPMRLGAIAQKAGLNPSTTRRILSSLGKNSLCSQNADGSYRLGLLLFELGSRVAAGFDLRDEAQPALRRLSELTHLTAFLCIRNGDTATAIERIDGRYAFSLALTVGGSLPLHVGGASRVFLAWESEEEVRSYLRRTAPLERLTPRSLTEMDPLLHDLRQSRARGYVISNEDVTPGVAAIGAPIFGHDDANRPIAAISVAGLLPQVLGDQREMILRLLLESAALISREMGHGITTETTPPIRGIRRNAA